MKFAAVIFDLDGQLVKSKEAVEFIDALKENGTPLALVASTNWEDTDKIIKQSGLENIFDTLTTGEEVVLPKPAGDLFLITSEKLGIDPADCLVIEDSESGVIAAKDTGMKVIAVLDDNQDDEIENADLVVGGISEITPKVIDALSLD